MSNRLSKWESNAIPSPYADELLTSYLVRMAFEHIVSIRNFSDQEIAQGSIDNASANTFLHIDSDYIDKDEED